jgi:hypothetical protein
MGTKVREVRKVIEPELLDQEDRAELIDAQQGLRGSVKIMNGHMTRISARLARPNRLVNLESIQMEINALKTAILLAEDDLARHRKFAS